MANNRENKKITCVIPAYNEEKRITEVIKDVLSRVDQVVIIDDCSADNTWQILSEFSDLNQEKLTILKHAINRGQGAALQTGNEYAINNGADIIVHFDADGQFLAEEINDLTEPLIKGEADIVFGSRFLEKKSDIPGLKKIIILPLGKIFNYFLGVNLSDPQSGFRAFNREVAEKIAIKQDRMAHCSEILHKTFKNKLRVKEVPITVIYHDFGQKFSGGIKIAKDILLSKIID